MSRLVRRTRGRSVLAPCDTRRVVVLSGPSGSGKSRLANLLHSEHGWPVVALDDFYCDASTPGLPQHPQLGIVDWDDVASWNAAAAVDALATLITDGAVAVPQYDIATSSIIGHHEITAPPGSPIIAEGIFAPDIIAALDERGILHSAWCVHRNRNVSFALRLSRDLAQRRKPPWTLVRRGLALRRAEADVVAGHVSLGARPAHPRRIRQILAEDLD